MAGTCSLCEHVLSCPWRHSAHQCPVRYIRWNLPGSAIATVHHRGGSTVTEVEDNVAGSVDIEFRQGKRSVDVIRVM